MALQQRIEVVKGTNGSYTYCPVVIIGAGASGLAMACRLKQRYGFNEFKIFDRQAGIGGTTSAHLSGQAVVLLTIFLRHLVDQSLSRSRKYNQALLWSFWKVR